MNSGAQVVSTNLSATVGDPRPVYLGVLAMFNRLECLAGQVL